MAEAAQPPKSGGSPTKDGDAAQPPKSGGSPTAAGDAAPPPTTETTEEPRRGSLSRFVRSSCTRAASLALLGPVKVGGGKTVEILEEGLKIQTRTGCFFSKPTFETRSWDDFRRCDVEVSCFSGVITLAQADGDGISLKVSLRKIRRVATAIYAKINRGTQGRVNPKVNALLGKQSNALIFDSGLVLKQSAGFCKKKTTFVPWEAVVSLSLRPGCFHSLITVATLLEQKTGPGSDTAPVLGKALSQVGAVGGPAVKPHDPQHDEGPSHLVVNITGKAEAMETVLKAMLELMNGGTAPKPLPDDVKVPGTLLTTLALVTTQGSGQRMAKHVLPWSSIASADLRVDWCKPKLVLTDSIGNETVLRHVGEGEYDSVRSQIAKAKGLSGSSAAAAVKPIIRRNIKLTGEGLLLTSKRFCSKETVFFPWTRLDAFEMDTHCFGGSLVLITEDGKKIQVCRAGPFGVKSMNELASRIQEMKYGKGDHALNRVFAGREGSRGACVLSDSSVRLVASKGLCGLCGSFIRILDLDSVNGCEVAGPRKLMVHMAERMAIDGDDKDPGVQPLEVKLLRSDDADDLAADLMRRAHERKRAEQGR